MSNARRWPVAHGRLFRKYALVLGCFITLALLTSGLVETWFSYHEHQAALVQVEQEQAVAAAEKIQAFSADIDRQISWIVPPAGVSESSALDLRIESYQRMLRQSPPITNIRYLDASGREALFVSRIRPRVIGSGTDYSTDPAFIQAQASGRYFGPVTSPNDSEPYMTISRAENEANTGVIVAEVNLKLIRDVISQIKVGKAGYAYVVDSKGYLIAHPDISLVLRKTDLSSLPQVRAALMPAFEDQSAGPITRNLKGEQVLTAVERVDPPGWLVFVDQPLEEALGPLYASLARTVLLLLAGIGISILLSIVLARRMVTPIRALQSGAARIGGGAWEERIDVHTGDELQVLAEEFNHMAERMQESHANLERQVEERTRELASTMHELEEKSRQLEIASRNKTEFLANMSHELRTPLNAIIGFSEVLNRRMYGPLNEKQEDYLRDIIGSGRHLLSLINDLLDISKVEAGRMDLELSRFPLAPLLENGLRMVRETAMRYGVTLDVQVDPSVGEIEADERKIKQAVFNLLSNAVKFNAQGGTVTVSARQVGDEVQVAVSDTGIGIVPEDQAHIFEEFRRAGRKDVRDREGTGLGLALTKALIELHGGRIWVESQLGVGTTFTFAIPSEHSRVTTATSILSPSVVLSARDASAPTVLVVEDDPKAIALLEAVLRSEGYRVVAATRGAEGLELARREQPGLVILDLLMPEMDGIEVVDRMRADPATAAIPIVMFTAKTVNEQEKARLGNRISHLAQKGDFDWPSFVDIVRRYYAPQAA